MRPGGISRWGRRSGSGDVDAVGDEGGARDSAAGEILKFVDNWLGGGDEGVGAGGEEFLEGPVPAGFWLEGVEGLDEEGKVVGGQGRVVRCGEGIRIRMEIRIRILMPFDEGLGEGGEEVGVDQ